MKKTCGSFRFGAAIILWAAVLAAACSTPALVSPTVSSTPIRSQAGATNSSVSVPSTKSPTRTPTLEITVTPTASPAPESSFPEYIRSALPDGALARLGKGLIYDMSLSPDGESAALATSIGVYRYRLDPSSDTPQETWFVPTTVPMTSVAFSLDGRTVAAGSFNSVFNVWGEPYLWPPATKDPAMLLLDSDSGNPAQALVQGSKDSDYRISRLAFSPDGTRLAAGYFINGGESEYLAAGIMLWNLADGTSMDMQYENDEGNWIGSVDSLAFSPDGSLLASGAYETAGVRVWDARGGGLLQTLAMPDGEIGSLAFSPDGTLLASGLENGSVTLWDTGQWKPARTLSGSGKTEKHSINDFRSHLSALRFSADGKRLAAGTSDGSIALWNPAAGTRLWNAPGQAGPVGALAFSAEGGDIRSVFLGGKIIRYDSSSGKPSD